MGECHIREGLDANDVIDGAKRERTLALVVSCQYLTSVHVRKSGKHQRNTSTMNRELTYYYQGDSKYFTQCRSLVSFYCIFLVPLVRFRSRRRC